MKAQNSFLVLLISVIFLFSNCSLFAQACFDSPINYGVLTGSSRMVTADLNGDGNFDLITASGNNGDIMVNLGIGLGSFSAVTLEANIPVSSWGPDQIITEDFNNDGKADIASANYDNGSASILLGDGTGGFSTPVTYAVGPGNNGNSLTSADFNGDSFIDLAFGYYGSFDTFIIMGNGDGTFGTMAPFASAGGPNSITSGDFNNDGKQDIARSNYNVGAISVILGDGLGGFGPPANYGTTLDSYGIHSADFNNDGNLDLATTDFVSSSVLVFLGDGTGSFLAEQALVVGTNPINITTSDYNDDGNIDMAVSNENSDNVYILTGDGTGSFITESIIAVGFAPTSIRSADFDNDGKTDLAVLNTSSQTISIIRNNQLSVISTDTDTICKNGTALISAVATGSIISWYANVSGGTALGLGATFTTPALLSTTSYFVETSASGCSTIPRTEVEIIVNEKPSLTDISGDVLCGAGVGTINALATGGTIGWFDNLTGGSPLQFGEEYITPTVSTTTTYYAEVTIAGCDTFARLSVDVIIYEEFNINQTISLSFGDSLMIGANTYKNSGVYVDSIYTMVGCDSIVTTNLTIQPQSNLYAFSPNNDGINDVWIIDVLNNQPDNQVTIFDRAGDVLIEFNNYNNIDIVWDGFSKYGSELEAGTFFYTLKLDGQDGQCGWVQIVR